jgi:flagellar protein FliO/FliZ
MFLDGVFGTEMPFVVKFFLAFLLVLGLIGVGAWGLRRFSSGRFGGDRSRGRQPRLGLIDHAIIDNRRRLILVRRDNVEHLLMIGGPTDVVVEANIVRAVAAPRDVALARPAAVEPLPRAIPLPDNGSWPLQPEVITPPPPARPAPKIEPATDEAPAWPPLQPQADTPPAAPATPGRPQRDTLAALADELSARPAPPPPPPRMRTPAPARAPLEARAEPRVVEPRPEPRAPAVQPTPAPAPADTASADQSLAEMAHRLEAALRKPNAEARVGAPQPRPEPRPEPRQAQPAEQAATPEPATPPAPPTPPSPPQSRAARPAEPKPARNAPPPAKPPQSTTLYDNLEQEMASLLGRPTNKS